ncbi:coiled-coil domain-containing protein 40 [Spodoptera frugiperda]|uniref:Coiled-coil domain-containing protein 40 n=1 Tax=Spodoptera frugiperda TaxID=7108 RepID=A0A9R0CY57_SPOFR|nr:coiled-coil domain-containing protein 40 [Spodoptera frugiperda]
MSAKSDSVSCECTDVKETEVSAKSESMPCVCTEDSTTEESLVSLHCECPRDEHDIVIHEETCLLYRSEKITFFRDPTCECDPPMVGAGDCPCCKCPLDQCRCNMAGREAFDEWRANRGIDAMPAVLEATHPLMQKFQETLKQFLIKENALAEEQILNLREELKLQKQEYDKELEAIYKSDHDTNAQRLLIEEYENSLAQRTLEREAAEKRAREAQENHKKVKAKLDEDIIREREATQEMEALNALCRQLEAWRNETDSDLTVSQRMSDKMRAEKQAIAAEKRRLDMFLFGLSNEVWKLESRLEMFKKQLEIKNTEMEKVNDRVTAYAAELDDLELDKRRLVSLWNSVIVNIAQRDKVYDSVRDDYNALQDNYRTLINSLDITKKIVMEEMNKSKEIAMTKDKLIYDIEHATKTHDVEFAKRQTLEALIQELTESIEMTERDQEMIKSENQTMRNILKSTEKEFDRRAESKMKLENEILLNLQECLLNDKAVESMANGIRKMREMSRKQEISLMTMENQHARILLEIEIMRNRHAKNAAVLQEKQALMKQKEHEIDLLQAEYDNKLSVLMRKQREQDIVIKKFAALKEIFDMKSPQERRIEGLEKQIKCLRDRTEVMQHEWLRQQGHVVKLADQHHIMVTDINLIKKQIQICEQKIMRIQAESDTVMADRNRVERSLRTLRGRLEVLERTRKDATERNENAQRSNLAISHEYAANLKDAETEIIQLEEEIEQLDKEKMNLTQELDRVQREALIWQRKGILAVELKKNIATAKSLSGEIGQMRSEIHRMEVRREQLRRTSEKLADDLALFVTRRDTAMEKTRAAAAVEKSHGGSNTSQSTYHHKLRLAKSDVNRVSKEITDAKAQMEQLMKDQERLDRELAETNAKNSQMEERVAELIKETMVTERTKHWLLERVVRAQRFGTELATAIKRQSVRCKKPKDQVLAEHEQARKLNERLRYIVGVLENEHPHLEDKLESISNTLNIFSPGGSPRLAASETCAILNDAFVLSDKDILDAAKARMGMVLEEESSQPEELQEQT